MDIFSLVSYLGNEIPGFPRNHMIFVQFHGSYSALLKQFVVIIHF